MITQREISQLAFREKMSDRCVGPVAARLEFGT